MVRRSGQTHDGLWERPRAPLRRVTAVHALATARTSRRPSPPLGAGRTREGFERLARLAADDLAESVAALSGARVVSTVGYPLLTSDRRAGRAPAGAAHDLRTA